MPGIESWDRIPLEGMSQHFFHGGVLFSYKKTHDKFICHGVCNFVLFYSFGRPFFRLPLPNEWNNSETKSILMATNYIERNSRVID